MTKKTQRPWRNMIDIHPAADLFPLMSETDPAGLQAMADSIAKNPMQVPDLTPVIHAELLNPDYSSLSQMRWKFSLLDGRNRLDAMELAGIKFALRPNPKSLPSTPSWLLDVIREDVTLSHPLDVETGDAWEYARRANIERRQLTRSEKRELIKAVLKATPEKSDRAIGKMVKQSKNTVAKVRAKEEARGQVDRVNRVDTKGRRSPTHKKTSSTKAKTKTTTSRRRPAGQDSDNPAAATAVTAPSKPALQWADGSTGQLWAGDMKAQTLIAETGDGKQFWVERYLSNLEPVFQVRLTLKDKLRSLQEGIAFAEGFHETLQANAPRKAPKPKKAPAPAKPEPAAPEPPVPRVELTPEASAAERKAQHAAAEDLENVRTTA